jgi:hypothetical protein
MLPIGTYLLALALVLVLGLVIALPLFDRKRPAIKPMSRRESLQHERQDIIRAIREVDFDHRTGKINDEDYKRVREDYVQRGAAVLRELNTLEEADIDDVIETKVAALRTTQDAAGELHCPKCQARVSDADKFCPQCGHALKPARQNAAS